MASRSLSQFTFSNSSFILFLLQFFSSNFNFDTSSSQPAAWSEVFLSSPQLTSTPQYASPAEELTFEKVFEGLIILIKHVILEDRTRSFDKKNQFHFTLFCLFKMDDITRQAGYSARYQLLFLIRFATNAFSIMLEPYLLPPFASDHFIQLIWK